MLMVVSHRNKSEFNCNSSGCSAAAVVDIYGQCVYHSSVDVRVQNTRQRGRSFCFFVLMFMSTNLMSD